MGSGTTITFVASDGFETTLPYSSIYTNPAVQARQGDAVIAWWGDGQYVPAYADGMRLFFMPSDHVYGQWDMHETLASQYWRYNFQDGVQYPSAAGLSAKYITTIKVYSSPESDWTLVLDGRDIGGINYNVSKPYLEEAIACQFGAEHKATYTDSKGRIWEGMPLWFFAGFVDDADQHSVNAYNETKALAGYDIVITGRDGYSTVIDSRQTIRSSNYLIANSLNGTHIADADENWPLRLAGANVSGGSIVKGVASIQLRRQVQAPSGNPTLVLPSFVQPTGFVSNVTVRIRNVTNAKGFGFNITYDPGVVHITNIRLNSSIEGSTLYTNISNSTGKANIGITSLDNITFTNATGIVDLTISTVGAPGSSTALSTLNAEWTDATWASNSLAVIPGSVTITMKGDFNQNGRVDIGDVTRVAYMGVSLLPADPFADFNGDGYINGADAAKIAYYYVGKIPAL